MTAGEFFARTWPHEPSVLLGCAALAAGYLRAAGRPVPRAAVWFSAGLLILLLALASPLDVLADIYLFSAHMAQHLLLLLVVPPLLLLGIPPSLLEQALRPSLLHRTARAVGHPAAAWALGVGTMWVWHLPALYNTALANPAVHIGQHLTFLATGVIFWWPIASPLVSARLRPLAAMLYLLAAAAASSALGIILTFAPAGLYPAYLHPPDLLGLEPVLRGRWGLSAEVDQQLGGLLMWVPGGLVYLCAILGTLARWYRLDSGVGGAHVA
jgi:putative membrane protein